MPLSRLAILAVVALAAGPAPAQTTAPEPIGIALEGFRYPHPVAYLPVTHGGESLRMAYMDVAPTGPANGRSVLLLHGRNFPASYWEPVAKALSGAGYRVVIPDQLGFGKSAKPGTHVTFDDMARNTAALLDRLGIASADVVAHSMGGMLGVRFTRSYPAKAGRLVLQAPIGLEDYRFYVPPVETEHLVEQERALTADGYRRQLLSNYRLSDPAQVEPYVELRERIRDSGEYERWLRSFAGSYQAIYREPVAHEIPLIETPVLFVMGARDNNAPGRPLAPEPLRARMGQNAKLAGDLAARMKNARATIYEEAGHMVHLDAEARFNQEVLRFLAGG
ncbi:alpha/beta fold hydrolase [uncultured Enterovirga sp.]|uniref:alpha/beta fold hydrolase n=1 Tax=uncultured Enterovirga sp. TaxID=2026352 RepID=UPI0035CC2826